jgi:endonuclease III
MRLSKKIKTERVLTILNILKKLFPSPLSELNYSTDYELLFAVIMSAQTTDVQVNKVTAKLFKKYKSLDDYANADLTQFTQDISNIGLYKNKAKNVLKTAQILLTKFGGKVPNTIKEIITLPGAARKTANVIQRELFGVSEGIAVDTHVLRLAKQLGLTNHTDAIRVEKDLMLITPRQEWGNISILLILYGRRFWKARGLDKGNLSRELGIID